MDDLSLQNQPALIGHSFAAAAAYHLLRAQHIEEALPMVLEDIGRRSKASMVLLYLTAPEFSRPDNPEGWQPSGMWIEDSTGVTVEGQQSRMLSSFYHALYPDGNPTAKSLDRDSCEGVALEYMRVLGVPSLHVVPFPVENRSAGLLLIASEKCLRKPVLDELSTAADIIGSAVGQQRTILGLKERSRSFLRLNTLTQTALERPDLTGMLEVLVSELMEMLSGVWGHIFLFPSQLADSILKNSASVDNDLFSVGVEEIMLPGSLSGVQNIKALPGIEIAAVNGRRWVDVLVGEGTLLVLPLEDGEERFGIVVLQFKQTRGFTIEEVALCDQAVRHITLGLSQANLTLRLEREVKNRTLKLSEAVEKMRQENTSRFLAERSLHTSQERLRSVTDAAPLGIIMLNAEGIIQFWNPAAERIFGYSIDQIVGKPLDQIFCPDSVRVFNKYIDKRDSATESERADFLAIEGISANGDSKPIEVSVGIYGADENRCYSILIRETSRELEFRRWAERQGQFAFAGKLAASVAQDLNTILSSIILYAELLSTSTGLSEKGRSYADMIVQQSQRAASLSTQILDVETADIYVQKPIDPVEFLENISGLMEYSLQEYSGIAILHGNEDYMISLDERVLRHVVLDLVFNLREVLEDEEEIEIKLERVHVSLDSSENFFTGPGEWIVIGINVQGEMDGSNNPLVDLSAYVDPNPRKLDLGISQLKNAVESQNGVFLHRHGSSGRPLYRICFPALTISENIEGEIPGKSTLSGSGTPVVLVVEDEETTRSAVREILSGRGYRVLEAENGRAALEVLRENEVHLIITDVIMPEMGGIALVNQVHKEFGYREIIIISGYPLGQGPGELLDSNGVRWLKKPINTGTLIRATAESLNRQFNQQQVSQR